MGAKVGNLEKGLFIYEDTSSSLAEKKYIRYKKEDLPLYKDKFEELVGEGIFERECLFEDHKWTAYGNHHHETFDFIEIEYNQLLYWPLKCFIIVQLYDRRMVVDSVHQGFKNILKVIKLTSTYDMRFFKKFSDFVELKKVESKNALTFYKHPNLAFLFFNPINDCKDYIEIFHRIKDIPGLKNDVREIPTYSNFLLFDELIHGFMLNTTQFLREKYYPIFIWWRLTAIIPIRPIEFIEIMNKGIYHDPNENAYCIFIPRRKQQPDPINKSEHIVIQQKLKITEEMFNIINNYRKTADIENEKYLFPVSFYRRFLVREKISIKNLHYTEHMSWSHMTSLLDDFFHKVIYSEYGINVVHTRGELDRENEHKTIKHFNLGDTRHMSICMMMMQGFSELTIAQMAGHTNIRTQSHYSSHIDDFQRSYSGLLQKEILGKMNIGDKSGFDNFTFRQKQLLSYSLKEIPNPRKIDYGECHSENFPYECFSKDCIFCNKFKIDLSKLSAKELNGLKNKITIIQDEIQVKLNFIRKYYSTAFKRKETSIDKNEIDRLELERNVMNLETLMNRKAMLEAHLKKGKEV